MGLVTLHTILRRFLLNPASLPVNLFLVEDEYGEILGLIDYLCFACSVGNPLQFLVSYCKAAPPVFWVSLMTEKGAEEEIKKI